MTVLKTFAAAATLAGFVSTPAASQDRDSHAERILTAAQADQACVRADAVYPVIDDRGRPTGAYVIPIYDETGDAVTAVELSDEIVRDAAACRSAIVETLRGINKSPSTGA